MNLNPKKHFENRYLLWDLLFLDGDAELFVKRIGSSLDHKLHITMMRKLEEEYSSLDFLDHYTS